MVIKILGSFYEVLQVPRNKAGKLENLKMIEKDIFSKTIWMWSKNIATCLKS